MIKQLKNFYYIIKIYKEIKEFYQSFKFESHLDKNKFVFTEEVNTKNLQYKWKNKIDVKESFLNKTNLEYCIPVEILFIIEKFCINIDCVEEFNNIINIKVPYVCENFFKEIDEYKYKIENKKLHIYIKNLDNFLNITISKDLILGLNALLSFNKKLVYNK